jgi:hypothetical protein
MMSGVIADNRRPAWLSAFPASAISKGRTGTLILSGTNTPHRHHGRERRPLQVDGPSRRRSTTVNSAASAPSATP